MGRLNKSNEKEKLQIGLEKTHRVTSINIVEYNERSHDHSEA